MLTRSTAQQGGQQETARLEAFSDGVFSIAITLLVLELIQFIHIKEGDTVFKSLVAHWQPFLAFLIGFTTILICWINHHYAFNFIHKVDPVFLWVNGFLLFMVTLTPLPTAILAESLKNEESFALAIFGFNFFMIGWAAYGICAYAYNHSLIDAADREYFNCLRLSYAYSIAYLTLAFLVCFLWMPLAILLYVILFSVFAFPHRLATRILKMKQKKRRTPVVSIATETVTDEETI